MSLATPGKIWFTYLNGALGSINTSSLAQTVYSYNTRHFWGLATDGTYLYVCCLNSPTTLFKMDLSGNLIDSYNIGNKLLNIVYDGTNLWATDYEAKKIYKISTSGVVLATISTDNFPYSLAYQSGYVYICCPFYDNALIGGVNPNNLLKINVSTNAVTETTIGVPGDIVYGLASDGTYLWAASNTDATSNILQINAAGSVINSYSVGDSLYLISYYDSVGLIGVSSFSTKKHYTINPEDGSVTQTDDVGNYPKNGSIDEFSYAYVGNYGDGTYSRFLINALAPPFTPFSVPITAPYQSITIGNLAYVATMNGSGYITKIDLTTEATSAITVSGGINWIYSLSNDSNGFWCIAAGWDNPAHIGLWKVDLLTDTIAQRPVSGLADRTLTHTSFLDKLWVATTTPAIYRINPVTETIIDTISLPATPNFMINDGTYVYCSHTAGVIKVNSAGTIVATNTDSSQTGDMVTYDATYLYLNRRVSKQVIKLLKSDLSYVATFTYSYNVNAVHLVQDNGKLFVSLDNNTVNKIDTVTGAILSTTSVTGYTHFFSSNGNGVLTSSNYGSNAVNLVDSNAL
jgi:hypothetical protein